MRKYLLTKGGFETNTKQVAFWEKEKTVMIIGVPKEVMDGETRLALLPKNITALVKEGHKVVVQKGAGEKTGYTDCVFVKAGAQIVDSMEEIYELSEMVVKFKDLQLCEQDLPFKENQIIFGFHHMGEGFHEIDIKTIARFREKKVKALSYELIQNSDGTRPIMKPMSEIAGKMAVLLGGQLLQKSYGGLGISLPSISGVRKAKVLIVGGGFSGYSAAISASGIGANVIIYEADYEKAIYLNKALPNVETKIWDDVDFKNDLYECDLFISAIYYGPGAKPTVTAEMLSHVKKGAVLIDLSCGYGIEGIKTTTISNPYYVRDGLVFCAIENFPAMVPQSSCDSFSAVAFTYIYEIACKGLKRACLDNSALMKSVSIINGKVVHKDISRSNRVEYTELNCEWL
jgi:alanine dehydrogenase